MANRYANLTPTAKIKDEFQKINAGFDAIQTDIDEIWNSGKVATFDLPLMPGMVNYKNITSSYDCKINKCGNVVSVTLSLTKANGNFTRGEQIATIPAGLRPKETTVFYGGLCTPADVNGSANPEIGGVRLIAYTSGTVNIYVDSTNFQGNRVFGNITYIL